MSELIPERVILSIVAFFGFMNLYLIRYGFSIITVAMITRSEDFCSENCTTSIADKNTFDWNERDRATILSSFSYGYILTQVIGGRLAEMYGSKIVYGSSIIIPGFLGFLMPKGAEISYWLLIVLRFFQGLIQGMSWPAMQTILSQWIPPNERARYMSIVFMSSSLSIVWVMPFSGYLCDAYSWQTAFYISSAVPIIWGIFWITLIYKKPSDHPRITQKEREYIEKSIREGGSSDSDMKAIPWKSIFTSVPLLAIIICDIANSIGLAIFTNQLPNFLKFAFDYQLTTTGFLAGIPFLSRYLGGVLFSLIADHLISNNIIKISTTRRIFSAIALLIPALILGITTALGMTSVTLFVSLACVYMFFNGSIGSSQLVNFTDISPNYAGTMLGISNSIANFVGLLTIMATGEILNAEASLQQWQIVFGTCIPFMVAGEVFYLIFMRGTPQPWNFYQDDLEKRKNEEIPYDKDSRTVTDKKNSEYITSF